MQALPVRKGAERTRTAVTRLTPDPGGLGRTLDFKSCHTRVQKLRGPARSHDRAVVGAECWVGGTASSGGTARLIPQEPRAPERHEGGARGPESLPEPLVAA